MKIIESQTNKLLLTDLDKLDPVCVYYEDYNLGQGRITITCYGDTWTTYWGSMGSNDLMSFFISCDEHYIAKKLSSIDSGVYDIDKIRADAENKGLELWRDDPWNDYDFMAEMYSPDPMESYDLLPTKPNPEYVYLCRIIKAVQAAFREVKTNQALDLGGRNGN